MSKGSMRTALLATAVVALAACGDGTGPNDGRFDPARLMADGQALEQVLSHNVFGSVSAAAASTDPSAGGAALVVADAIARSARAGSADRRGVANEIARTLLARAPELTKATVLPPTALGKTYVYDPAAQQYVLAPTRSGAPSNGARFILYAVNPITHQPVVTAEVGHADLIDRGGSSLNSIELQLLVVSGGVTHLDYTLELTATPTSGELSVNGFLTDGSTRVDFEIDLRGSSGTVTTETEIDFELAIRSRDFSVEGHAEAVESVESGLADIELLVRSGGARIRYDVTGSSTTIHAEVYVNDRLFATITGDPAAPTVTGANGQALTEQEVQALVYLIHLADAVFAVVGALLVAPIAFIGFLTTIP